MTFADLYHLNNLCKETRENLKHCVIDNGIMPITITTYEDIKRIIGDCEGLIYDVCQTDVKDVINRDT